jgi:myo-inositol-1(or 4)-monophosphatase
VSRPLCATTAPVSVPPSPPPPSSPAGELSVEQAFGPPGDDALLTDLSRAALRAAQAAATLLADAVGRPRQNVEVKSSATDMVSEVDRGSEDLVRGILAELRPDDGLLGEEGSSKPGTTGIRWVVDPLDGTTNFLFGVPQFSVSIAAEIAERPVVGVVIDPSRRETWAARLGGGARCNGVPCRVSSGRSTLATALVATGFGYQAERRAWQGRVAAIVLPRIRDLRRFGSAALDLCWVAGGRVDAYYEWGLSPWDLSAGRLICSEAGGHVEILPPHTVVASTPELAGPLADLLVEAGVGLPLEA